MPRNAESLANDADGFMICLKRTILIAVCLAYCTLSFFAQGRTEEQIYRITVGNKSGFIDQHGKVVITPRFDGNRYMLSDFSEGLAEFKDMKALPEYPFSKEGYIDISGRIVIAPQFDVAYDFSNGRAQVKIGDLTSFINKTGKQVIKLEPYQAAGSFREGLAAIYSNFEFWFIDVDGNTVIPKQAGLPKDFSEGLACVYLPVGDKLKAGYIDKDGKVVISPQYENGYDFSEGLAAVEMDGKYGFIDKTGQVAIKPYYKSAYGFADGLARVSSGEKYGFIDVKGSMVIPEKFDVGSWGFSEGFAPACENGVCGYIDPTGRYVIAAKFNAAFNFKNGIASVLLANYRNAYIDKQGSIIWREIRK